VLNKDLLPVGLSFSPAIENTFVACSSITLKERHIIRDVVPLTII
jgi:hypothetical protein